MCIRDRDHPGGAQPRGRLALVVPQLEILDGDRRTQAAHPCLLYTSDAADERSRVDLGGRRIIKKKKNNDTAC